MSRPYARDCCNEFDKAVITMYAKEWLRLPVGRRRKILPAKATDADQTKEQPQNESDETN
jgi:hypothetical protein